MFVDVLDPTQPSAPRSMTTAFSVGGSVYPWIHGNGSCLCATRVTPAISRRIRPVLTKR